MEPQTKRLKTGQAFYDAVEEEVQDELAMTPFQFDAHQDPMYELDKGRAKAATRLRSTFEHIFDKYEKDFTDVGDEIDLETGEIIVNNGHIESMRFPNEDGTRSDEESVSSAEEERILTGKPSEKSLSTSMSTSMVKAASSSEGIGQGSSAKWDIPIVPDHQMSSLTMAPSLFGAPPPFSFGSSLPNGESSGATWQAPNIPTSLFQDNFGFRNQFMGYPGAVEYNSFGQVRVRSSYRDVFGQPAPKKFSTPKEFARKALLAAASEDTSETDEDDILLGKPPADPEPVEKAAPSTVRHSSAENTVASKEATSKGTANVSEDKDNTVEKIKRKPGRPRKTATINNGADLHHEAVVNTVKENERTLDVPSASTDPIQHQALANEPQKSQSPSKSLPPTEQSVAPSVEESGRVPNDTIQSDTGHRKPTPVREQLDDSGERVLAKQRQDKQESIESIPITEDISGEEVVKHARESGGALPDPTVPAVGEDKQNEDTAMPDVEGDIRTGDAETSSNRETSPDLGHEQRTSIQLSEVPNSPILGSLSAEVDQSQSQRSPENQHSSRPENKGAAQDPVPSVPNILGDRISNLDVVSQSTSTSLRNGTGPVDAAPAEEVNWAVMIPHVFINAKQYDVVEEDQFEPEESHSVDAVGHVELPGSANAVGAEEHRTISTSESPTTSQNQPREAMSPDLSSGITHESKPDSQALVERPKEPEGTRRISRAPSRSRKQSPNRTRNIPSQSPQQVSDTATDTPDPDNNENLVGPEEVTETPTTPSRRTRDLVIRESPPPPPPPPPQQQAHDDKSTPTTATEQDITTTNSDTAAANSLARRRGDRAQKRKPPTTTPETPETPKRKKPRDSAVSATTTAITTPITTTTTTTPTTTNSTGWDSNSSKREDTSKRRKPTTNNKTATTSPSSSSSTPRRLRHLTAPPRRVSLTSLIPDDPECEDEELMSILTPTSTNTSASSSNTPTRTPTNNSSSITPMSSFRARLGLGNRSSSSNAGNRRVIPATTPRRKYRSSLLFSGNGSGGGSSGVQSSPLARTVAARNLLMATPRRPRAGRTTGLLGSSTSSGRGSSPTAARGEGVGVGDGDTGDEEGLVRTPGGTVRRCGEGGFVCKRDFCFTCCK